MILGPSPLPSPFIYCISQVSFFSSFCLTEDLRTVQGRTGILVVKTKQAVLVGHYGEGAQAGNSAQTVEALADYLIKVGY